MAWDGSPFSTIILRLFDDVARGKRPKPGIPSVRQAAYRGKFLSPAISRSEDLRYFPT